MQELLDIIERFKSHLVIVEGIKDRRALQELGFKKIVILNKPLYAIVEEVVETGAKTVLILTDLDKEGKKLYSYLYKHLTERGVKIDNKLREYLFKETQLRQIEGLVTYVSNQNL